MKVVHLISGGDTGGAKTHVHSLLQMLKHSIDVTMICFTEGPFVQEARALGIPTEVFSGVNIIKTLRRLKALVQTRRFELIHCHGARGNLMGILLARLTGLPVISTVHSDYRLDYLGRPFSRWTYGIINTLALRKMDFRIGVSDAMVDLLITRGFDPERLFSIYNGLDFSQPLPKYARKEYLDALGLSADDDSVVVGIAARLNPVKDVATLIRGFAKAHAKLPALRLLIAGDGAQMQTLQALAEELGVSAQVCFAGWIDDTAGFYQSIDINTLTSISETFPYALTEGARAALPTISSQVGGVPYLIDHGANGFLFPPGDADTLSHYLLLLGRDAQLRREMGARLYEKAKRAFSLEATVTRQLEIYETVLRWEKREQVVICGAYGKGNAGDDAILLAILSELRALNPSLSFHVLSRNPKETRLNYRVNALYTFHFFQVASRLKKASLYINGGGSLMQDVTSWRSLWFYLWTLYAGKRLGCKVLMYGCGIGPITAPSNRRLAARILQNNVDVITLRDPHSLQELGEMGVDAPELLLSADPTVTLPAAPDELIHALFQSNQMDPEGAYIGFIVRPWPGFEEKAAVFAEAANYAYKVHGLTPVFFPIEPKLDIPAARKVTAHVTVPHHIFPELRTPAQTIGFLSHMRAVVSMRLHGLIFSAGQGVPLVGVVYDPKVRSFLSYIGQDLCLDLEEADSEKLCRQIDLAVRRGADRAFLAEGVARLREVEARNAQAAAKLLGLPAAPPE